MRTRSARVWPILAAVLTMTACGATSPASTGSGAPSVESAASSTSLTPTEQATRSGLGISVTEYRHRATEALAASAAAARFSRVTPGVETVWLDPDGTPVLGVSTESARQTAQRAHWTTRLIPPRWQTDERFEQAQQWLKTQDPRTQSSIVLMWPDYTTGAINSARNTLVDPMGGVPDYPADLNIRDVPGKITTPTADRAPINPPLHSEVLPGDAFRTGKEPDSTCTVGVPTATGFITVTHCTSDTSVARTTTGQTLGTPSTGPNRYTRIIDHPMPQKVRAAGGSTVTISATAEPVIGAPICKAGARSGWQCGTIVGLQGPDSFISTSCSLKGDSGGPALIGWAAVGVTDVSTIGNQTWCPSVGSTTLAYTMHRSIN